MPQKSSMLLPAISRLGRSLLVILLVLACSIAALAAVTVPERSDDCNRAGAQQKPFWPGLHANHEKNCQRKLVTRLGTK